MALSFRPQNAPVKLHAPDCGIPMTDDLRSRLADALARIPDPHTGTDLGTAGAVKGIGIDGDRVAVEIVLGYPAAGWHAALVEQARKVALAVPGVAMATVEVRSRIVAHKVQNDLTPLPEVRNIIAIASG